MTEDSTPRRPPTANADSAGGSPVLRLWDRIPRPLRAILSGSVVFLVLQNGWLALFLLNLRVLPEVPWSTPLGLLWLWVLFRWFDGRWAPASTAARRRRAMRAPRLGGRQWLWALLYLPLFLAYLVSVIQVAYRFVVIPEDHSDLSMLPWWTLYPSLVMLSINAGVSEEAGFRGYLQGGLERSFGPAPAILVTSLLFWLAHLNHASGPARFVQLMAMSAGLGVLAWCAGSIWPSVVAHAAVDTIFFVASAAGVAPRFMQHPPPFAETGIDGAFVLFSLLLLVTIAAGGFVLRRLAALRPAGGAPSPGARRRDEG